jgi:hypothetical protein
VCRHSSKCMRVAVIPAISGVSASANAPPVPFPLAFPVRSLTRWTGWSWQTRFSGLPGSRRYSVVKFNSVRDIPLIHAADTGSHR